MLNLSGQSHTDRVPYAAETPLGWAVTNWLSGEQRVASPYNAFKVYVKSAGEEEELQRLLTAQSEVDSLAVVKLADPVRSHCNFQGVIITPLVGLI